MYLKGTPKHSSWGALHTTTLCERPIKNDLDKSEFLIPRCSNLAKKDFFVHFIKCFRKVQDDCINLKAVQRTNTEVAKSSPSYASFKTLFCTCSKMLENNFFDAIDTVRMEF